jgi:Tol biopolymer transport system component
MTQPELEQQLRAWSRAEGSPGATVELRTAVLAIPDTTAVGHPWLAGRSDPRRLLGLLLVGALVAAALAGSAVVLSSGEIRLPWERSINHPNTALSLSYDRTDSFFQPTLGLATAVHVVDLTTGGTRPVATVAFDIVADPVWSPDRTSIAFIDRAGLHVVEVPSGSTRDHGLASSVDTRLAWSPDGTSVAASGRGSPADRIEMQVIDVRTGSRVVTGSGAVPAMLPWSHKANIVGVDWTPSGELLAYLVDRTYCVNPPSEGEIGGVDCGGSPLSDQGCQLIVARTNGIGRALVHDLGPSCDPRIATGLAWIDEGRVLAAIGPELLIIDADTGAKRVVDVSSDAAAFDVSPDRQRIAWLSFGPDSASVVVSDLTGTVQLQLEGPCGGACTGLSWAPDGRRRLLLGSQVSESSTIDAWVISAADGTLTALTIASSPNGLGWFEW